MKKRFASILGLCLVGILFSNVALAYNFWRPVSQSTPVSAYKDLNSATGSIRDWTGWTGTSWVYGHAYDQHSGTDYDGETGDNVYNIQAGTVVETYQYQYNTYPNGTVNNGTFTRMTHADGGTTYESLYGHLKWRSQNYFSGAVLNYSTILALMNNTGYSSGSHLHLRVKRGSTTICPYEQGLMQ